MTTPKNTHTMKPPCLSDYPPISGKLRKGWIKNTHTPGKWIYDGLIHSDGETPDHALVTTADGIGEIALVFYGKTPEEIDANARLIAAAPALLAALEIMVSLHEGQEHLYGLTIEGRKKYKQADNEARAAIAAGKGEPK